MIYSIENNFVFLHCPRTSGTALSSSLQVLVPDAVLDIPRKHIVWSELPKAIQTLRAFTILRPIEEVRPSYYRHVTNWYKSQSGREISTLWLLQHAQRMSSMTLDEYLKSEEPPVSVDGYADGCSKVFQFHERPYREIAEFCGINPDHLVSLMEIFRGQN